jgi:hypothetical protein
MYRDPLVSTVLASEVNSEICQWTLNEIGDAGSLGGVCCPSWPLLMPKLRHGGVDSCDWVLFMEILAVEYLSWVLRTFVSSAILGLGPPGKMPIY